MTAKLNIALQSTRHEISSATSAQKAALIAGRNAMAHLEKQIEELQEQFDALDSFVSDLESAIEENERLEKEVNDIAKTVLTALGIVRVA